MIYTTYLTAPVNSPYLRHFELLSARGKVPPAKLTYEWFTEEPVKHDPPEMAENTTLEKTILVDKYDPMWEMLVFTRYGFTGEPRTPHHVHLKFDLPRHEASWLLGRFQGEPGVVVQQNRTKLPRERLIVTVFTPVDVEKVVGTARTIPGYVGAVADILIADNLD